MELNRGNAETVEQSRRLKPFGRRREEAGGPLQAAPEAARPPPIGRADQSPRRGERGVDGGFPEGFPRHRGGHHARPVSKM